MKYKIAIGGIMGVPITFLDKYNHKMGGGMKSSDLQVRQCMLDCLDVMQLSMERTCTIESSFAEKFKIIKFRKGNDEKDLCVNGVCPYFRVLIRRKLTAEV